MMIKDVKIRKATETDYETVNSFYYETYSLYYRNIPESYQKTPKNILPRGTFLNMIEGKRALVVVAELKSKIVGLLYATIEKEEGDEVIKGYHRISVDELYVEPSHRNKGVGSLLMQDVEKWAKKKRINDLTVLVYAFNQKSLKFYENHGYKPYSIRLDKKI